MPRTIEIKRDATPEEVYQKVGESMQQPDQPERAVTLEKQDLTIEELQQEIAILQNDINFYKEVLDMENREKIFEAMCVKNEMDSVVKVFKKPGSSKLKKAVAVSVLAITLLAPALAKSAEAGSERYNTATTWGKIITDGVTKIYKDRQKTKQTEIREQSRVAREEIKKEREIAEEMIEESEKTERTEANVHGKVMKEAIKKDSDKTINYDMGRFGGPTNMDIQQGGGQRSTGQSSLDGRYQESEAERARLEQRMAQMERELEQYKMEVSRKSLADIYE
jgi:hypothetical protein